MQNNVIIVAGGKGLRMGNELPKQFIAIAGKPVLMHTIEAFYNFDRRMNIVVVLPDDFVSYWERTCREYDFKIYHTIVTGGETRFHSVKNGLEQVQQGLVAVHDAARPLVSVNLIEKAFQEAALHKAVIPVIDVADSLRKVVNETDSEIIDRSNIKQVQTPQVFKCHLIKEAYKLDYNSSFTDDASVIESNGGKIHLIDGERSNIKITTPFDLEIARFIISNKG